MAKRLNIEEIREYMENECNEGYILLDNNYINSKTKLKTMCNKNHVFYVNFNNFKNGSRCPDCNNASFKHGLSKHPLYTTLTSMKDRCYNPNSHNYKNYGGRGITICDEWLIEEDYTGLKNFIEWGMNNDYRPLLSIERIDVDKEYSPQNCKFISMEKQQANKQTTKYLTINGDTKHLSEWARLSGIKVNTLHRRIDAGWSTGDLLKPPIKNKASMQSGIIGITWNKTRCKWKVMADCDGQKRFLGWFKNLDEAKNKKQVFENLNC